MKKRHAAYNFFSLYLLITLFYYINFFEWRGKQSYLHARIWNNQFISNSKFIDKRKFGFKNILKRFAKRLCMDEFYIKLKLIYILRYNNNIYVLEIDNSEIIRVVNIFKGFFNFKNIFNIKIILWPWQLLHVRKYNGLSARRWFLHVCIF
jgi:hypothetical protein